MKVRIVLAALAVLLIAGGLAWGGGVLQTSATQASSATVVPADAAVYATVDLSPSGDQKLALASLLSKFPDTIGSPSKLAAQVQAFADDKLSDTGLDYSHDVSPWLGGEVALWAKSLPAMQMTPGSGAPTAPEGALLLATTDPGAAMDAVHKTEKAKHLEVSHATYKGTDYDIVGPDKMAVGAVEDFLEVGTVGALKASVDASTGSDLGSSRRFRDAFNGLRSDVLASLYVSGADISGQLAGIQGLAGSGGLKGHSAAVVYARPDALVVDSRGPLTSDLDFSKAAAAVKRAPEGAWLTLADPGFGKRLRHLYDNVATSPFAIRMIERGFKRSTGLSIQGDLLSWMGELDLFAEGGAGSEPGGAVTIATTAPAATSRALDQLAASAPKWGLRVHQSNQVYRFSSEFGPPIYATVTPSGLQIGLGRTAFNDAVDPSSSLTENPIFQDAGKGLGDGYEPTIFLNLSAVVRLVGADAPQYLRPLEYAVLGAKKDGKEVIGRLVIGVR